MPSSRKPTLKRSLLKQWESFQKKYPLSVLACLAFAFVGVVYIVLHVDAQSSVGVQFVVTDSSSSTSSESSSVSSSTSSEASSSPGTTGGNGGATASTGNRRERTGLEWPIVIERRWLPGKTSIATERVLDPEEARNVQTCYIDAEYPHKAAEMHYTDVAENSWYADGVRSLFEAGILDASQERFRPEDPSTRAELTKLLVMLDGGAPEAWTPRKYFDDVPHDAWFTRYMEFAAEKGWVRGYNNCFGTHPCNVMPSATISRAEATALLVRFFGLQPNRLAPAFSDVESSAWYAGDIATAADHCVLQGVGTSRRAEPAKLLTRAEMIVLLDRAHRELIYGVDCSIEKASGDAAASLSNSRRVQSAAVQSSTESSLSPSTAKAVMETSSLPASTDAAVEIPLNTHEASTVLADQKQRGFLEKLAGVASAGLSFFQKIGAAILSNIF